MRPYLAMVPITSIISRTPINDVTSEMSYGGDTSQTSMAAIPSLAMPSTSFKASLGRSPPGSGQPVPGTNPASIESMSNDM